MLTKAGCEARRARMWQALPEDVEWVLVADPRHVHYLSNFWIQPLSFSSGERGWLLLERGGDATLLADNFALRSAAGEPHVDREVVEDWYDHRNSVINRDHALLMALRSLSDRLRGRSGIVEAEWLPLAAWELLDHDRVSHTTEMQADHPGKSAPGLGMLLRQLRRQKDDDEIALIQECMRATDAGQARAREVVRAGISEFEIYREVQAAALAEAGRPGLVYGDFRGVNAQTPKAGGLPTDYRLQHGDLFILDFSVVLAGYRSDFTNTIAVGGPTDQQLMLFELCEAALRDGEALLKAGAAAKDVYAGVAGPFRDSGYGDAFPHHAGHGIGLAHPEPPILVPDSDDVLMAGDVVTLEPGLYVEGIGGMRIEHNYLITNTGAVRLSNHIISLS
jgi:Xaa-Pro aminopeptidase